MKSIHNKLLVAATLCCLSLAGSLPVVAAESAKNAIQAFNVAPQGGDIVVKIDFKEPLSSPPATFSVSKPARIALDFQGVVSSLDRSSQVINQGDLSSVNVVQVGDRTRLVLNLVRSLNYETKVQGNSLIVSLKSLGAPVAAASVESRTSRFAQEPLLTKKHSVSDISFRRGKDGEARILVDLSDPGVGIDVKQQGTTLVVDFMKTSVPEHLKRKLDVTDFATPVTVLTTTSHNDNTRMVITPKGLWEHTAYQSDNQFVVEVKPIVEDPNKLVQGSKIGYQGPRVSINYQNGDVRALLRLMAEELGLNAVISETVTGTTTLVLKDVPADQVIHIIFQQKGLDMRKNGNVIMIAPREELALREKLDAEAKQDILKIEPLRMEAIQLNYQRADALAKLLMGGGVPQASSGGGASTGAAGGQQGALRMLTPRGSVTADPVTNQLFINDVPSKIEEIKQFVKLVDVGARQVLIEARVVEATDTFGKDIGVRLGLVNNGRATLNGGENKVYLGGPSTASPYNYPYLSGPVRQLSNDNFGRQTIDFKLVDAAGKETQMPGIQMGTVNLPSTSRNAAAFALSLFNQSLTKVLNIELSALETDGKGKIISSPKVVTANNVEAKIEDGYEIPYVVQTQTGPQTLFKKASLILKAKPQITPDGRVKMEISINKDAPVSLTENPPIKTTNITTEAIVDNGGTIVIGGVFSTSVTNDTERIPFLGDLPYVGFLFKHNNQSIQKRELLIFLTPRILNEQLTLN